MPSARRVYKPLAAWCIHGKFFADIVIILFIMQIKLCDRCQRNSSQLKSPVVELNPIPVKPQVWHMVGMDLIGPFEGSVEGHKYALTVTDYFSKFVEAVAIEDKSAFSVARGIYKVYCRQGAPMHIICDQGKEFINKVFILATRCKN